MLKILNEFITWFSSATDLAIASNEETKIKS